MRGNDDKPWVAVSAKNGVQRWTSYTSATLNGLRVLTLDYLRKHVGKPVVIYDRSARDIWPSGVREKDMESYTFVPDGDAQSSMIMTRYKDWLFTRSPSPPARGFVMITGTRTSSLKTDIDRGWGPIVSGNEIASSNPRNTQSFVKA